MLKESPGGLLYYLWQVFTELVGFGENAGERTMIFSAFEKPSLVPGSGRKMLC